MQRHTLWLIFIVMLTAFATWVSLPDNPGIFIDIDQDGAPEFALHVTTSLGLDLVSGQRVLLQAELPPGAFSLEDLQQTANNVARRINALGVAEATVQIQGADRILVELPGITDPELAVATIQQTALLEFVDMRGLGGQVLDLESQQVLTTEQLRIFNTRDLAGTPPGLVNPLTGQPFETVMTGAGLQSAAAQTDVGAWYIQFEITPEFQQLFGSFTGASINEPMGIVLDGVLLSAPTIQARLDVGGVIEGEFSENEAKQLALQLRSGALPIPLRVESSETVGATLGQTSVNLSVRAGIIGVVVVLLFMTIYYRVPGVAAALALLVFIVLNIAVFKLVPITLTLASITGFLISIGTAVDGNILIFERIKEELRAGRDLEASLDAGFERAWQSIRDSNLSTIILCIILFFFGLTPGASIVSGFAVTLALGLLINLFTAVIVTRTFLGVIVALLKQPLSQRAWLLGV